MQDRFLDVFQPSDIHRGDFSPAFVEVESKFGLDSRTSTVLYEIFYYLDAVGVWCEFSADSLKRHFERLVKRAPLWSSKGVDLEKSLTDLTESHALSVTEGGQFTVAEGLKRFLYPYCFAAQSWDGDTSLAGTVPVPHGLAKEIKDGLSESDAGGPVLFVSIPTRVNPRKRTGRINDVRPLQSRRRHDAITGVGSSHVVSRRSVEAGKSLGRRTCTEERGPAFQASN